MHPLHVVVSTMRKRLHAERAAGLIWRRSDFTAEEKDATIEELVREITTLWQTDELRRRKPTPLDGARTPAVPPVLL